ncbi:S24 family peptidase [Mesorhizobium sp. KR2-14]|uniref:XRE family transcriptional regulator n=1 Tax=Mesorhizobium sp. KR2-14 TaxID=3156610 RepID=UPI0032B47391
MLDDTQKLVAERLAQRLKETGKTAAAVSRAAGRGQDFIRDFMIGRKRRMNADDMARIARELGVTVPYLLGEEVEAIVDSEALAAAAPEAPAGKGVPIYGRAAGSYHGALHIEPQITDWAPCPPGVANVRDAYALWVVNDSMVPRFRHGDIVFVEPHRPVRPGDDVVIQLRPDESNIVETWVKEFVRYQGDDIVVKQFNPPKELVFRRNQVVEMQRIMPINEIVGV